MSGWEVFPFEQSGLQVVRLDPPQLPEEPRGGVGGGADCLGCTPRREPVWADEHWKINAFPSTGAPLILMLQSQEHYDLPDLPDDRAGELGRLIVHVVRAVEGLDHIARCHVSRWGDGGEHLHVFFFARPEGFSQLRGTCFALWDDLLPRAPAQVQAADVAAFVQRLSASYR